jgi:hypothetical protein
MGIARVDAAHVATRRRRASFERPFELDYDTLTGIARRETDVTAVLRMLRQIQSEPDVGDTPGSAKRGLARR